MIAPIRQNTLADTVEGRLRQFIRKRGFHPGDALPKETELAAQLDVSRNVVREALSRLRMLGIVESRRRGT
jgi:DNA-binding FadR family transcriptional regulator